MLSFTRYALSMAWRYGVRAVNAAVAYARNNWTTVARWITATGPVYALEQILRTLGYL